MTHADWHAAIIAYPDDDLVRLAYADWVEEQGGTDRAAWMRISVERARRQARAETIAVQNEERAAFTRCVPKWAVARMFHVDRGLIDFRITGPDDLKALRRAWRPVVAWAGWVLRATHTDPTAQNSRAVLAAWRDGTRLAGVPLAVVMPADPDAGQLDTLAAVLALPAVDAVEVGHGGLAGRTGELVAGAAHVRGMTVDLHAATDAHLRAGFERFAWPPSLRRAVIRGRRYHGVADRPNDADILRLVGHANLRRLRLVDCHAVTDAAIAALCARTPGVVVTR